MMPFTDEEKTELIHMMEDIAYAVIQKQEANKSKSIKNKPILLERARVLRENILDVHHPNRPERQAGPQS